MIDRICCAKCMLFSLKSNMRLIKMGKAKRLVCQSCFEKRNVSWFKGEKKDAGAR